MTEPKFCKDCKHFKAAEFAQIYGLDITSHDVCNQPSERELIHGRKIPASPKFMRAEYGDCKKEGLLWEEKPAPAPAPAPKPIPKPANEWLHDHPQQKEAWAPGGYIVQQTHPQPKAWWEFWK